KRVFLLSQMIHNQEVNNDLISRGIKFIMDTDGTQFIAWDALEKDDVVIVPAFGTTLEVERLLLDKGIEVARYNTTCPFVEKVWNRSEKLGMDDYTIIIHGKPRHEETRATFSHSSQNGHSVVVRDMDGARSLAGYILGEKRKEIFYKEFEGNYSEGLDPEKDLQRLGVVNQTTMLATETQAIADFFRQVMIQKYGSQNLAQHFADTRDTLCYATNDNQEATYKLLEAEADLAVVVGGYNSSNTSHIVELCERKFETYFVNSDKEIISKQEIHHFNYHKKEKVITRDFLPEKNIVKIILTSGASCPDTLVDHVMMKILGYFNPSKSLDEVLEDFGTI
ncbi:MAG: 4-hydroxy-3-methylbut-2-enyl diphosphate reductase, partial [Marivirga sp.]|nr:4-hydroxy-3-methylbut-2-enyl diphosphate reductase [Marivirga sp.]